MRNRHLRFWILFALLLGASYFSVSHFLSSGEREEPIELSVFFPIDIGQWHGDEAFLAPGTLRILGTDNVLFRTYSKPGRKSVHLCTTFTAHSHRTTHPPEVCYEGQGWEVQLKEGLELTLAGSLPAKKMVTHFRVYHGGNGVTHDVVVWYRTPSYDTASFVKQKFAMLFSRLFSASSWSVMVRLSCDTAAEGGSGPLDSIADFAGCLLPCLDRVSRELEAK